MSHLTFDRSIHSHCCPHKNFSASCSSDFHYAQLLQAWSRACCLSSLNTTYCFVSVYTSGHFWKCVLALYTSLLDFLFQWASPAIYIHATVTVCHVLHLPSTMTSCCQFWLFIQHLMLKKGQSFVTCDLWLQKHFHARRVKTKWPRMFFFTYK